MNPIALKTFVYFVTEREAIRRRKEDGEEFNGRYTWTDDDILHRHHFCNVRRQDDRGTKEIQAVVKKYVDFLPLLPRAYVVARMLNHAPSLNTLFKWGWNPEEDSCNSGGWDMLKALQEEGSKVFHTAYVVSTCGKSMNKVDYVREVARRVTSTGFGNFRTCIGIYTALRNIDGLGSFLAGQVVADLKNDRYLIHAQDWWTFSVIGPGSKKGLNYLFDGGTTEHNYQQRMDILKDSLPVEVAGLQLHMQDLQNCLCEFSKYMRYVNNEPGRRRYYR